MKAAKYFLCGMAVAALVLGSRLESAAQNVTYDEILHSATHPEDWLTYGGNYAVAAIFRAQANQQDECGFAEVEVGLPAAASGNIRIFSDRRGRDDVCDRAADHGDGA